MIIENARNSAERDHINSEINDTKTVKVSQDNQATDLIAKINDTKTVKNEIHTTEVKDFAKESAVVSKSTE